MFNFQKVLGMGLCFILLSCIAGGPVIAAVVVDGSTVQLDGTAGIVRFDVFASANGNDEQISGFQVPIEFESVATFSGDEDDFNPNPAFDLLKLVSRDGDAFVLSAGANFEDADDEFSDLRSLDIADGSTSRLFSFDVTVAGLQPGLNRIGTLLNLPGSFEIVDNKGEPIVDISIAGNGLFVNVTAVPEPKSLTFLAVLIGAVLARRRRSTSNRQEPMGIA